MAPSRSATRRSSSRPTSRPSWRNGSRPPAMRAWGSNKPHGILMPTPFVKGGFGSPARTPPFSKGGWGDLVDFEVRCANQLAPLLDLALRERGELLRIGGDDLEARVEETVPDLGQLQRLQRLGVQAVDDCLQIGRASCRERG